VLPADSWLLIDDPGSMGKRAWSMGKRVWEYGREEEYQVEKIKGKQGDMF